MLRSLIVFLLLAAAAAAQNAPIVLKAARLFDGKADRVVTPGLVVVQSGKITQVGGSVPAVAQVIDLGDATLLPGFIDAHTHITGEPGADRRQDYINDLQRTTAEKTLDAAAMAKRTLEAGFTTIRNLGAEEFIDIGLRNSINRGVTEGPRILAAAKALGTTGGHCDPTDGFAPKLFPEPGITDGIANTPDGFRAAVRYMLKNGADVIKVCATGGVLSLADDVDSPQLTQEELNALIAEAHAHKRKVAAHAHGNEGARRAILAGVDSIEHGSFMKDETLDLMKQHGTVFIPTLLASYSLIQDVNRGAAMDPRIVTKLREAYAQIGDTYKRALRKGVIIGFGTDAGVYRHGRNAEEFGLLVRGGLPPIDALKAATSVDAELLGLSSQIGTLEAGKAADIVAVPGDPSHDITVTQKVLFVMKGGRVVRSSSAKE